MEFWTIFRKKTEFDILRNEYAIAKDGYHFPNQCKKCVQKNIFIETDYNTYNCECPKSPLKGLYSMYPIK